MELNRENRMHFVADAGHSAIVEMPVGDLELIAQTLLKNMVVVILRRDEDSAFGLSVKCHFADDWMIHRMVAKFEFAR